jgi:hypothetical protein
MLEFICASKSKNLGIQTCVGFEFKIEIIKKKGMTLLSAGWAEFFFGPPGNPPRAAHALRRVSSRRDPRASRPVPIARHWVLGPTGQELLPPGLHSRSASLLPQRTPCASRAPPTGFLGRGLP